MPHPVERVVGVDQQDGVLRRVLHECAERLFLALEGHHVRVRHRPHRLEAVVHGGGHVRRPRGARDGGAARDLHGRVDAVITPRREVDHAPALARAPGSGGEHDACRLGGDRRLEVHLVEQQRLEQLRLDPRGGHSYKRLAGESNRSLRQGVHVAGEAEAMKVRKEGFSESEGGEVVELALAESACSRPARAPGRSRRRAASCGAPAGGGPTARTPPGRSSRA